MSTDARTGARKPRLIFALALLAGLIAWGIGEARGIEATREPGKPRPGTWLHHHYFGCCGPYEPPLEAMRTAAREKGLRKPRPIRAPSQDSLPACMCDPDRVEKLEQRIASLEARRLLAKGDRGEVGPAGPRGMDAYQTDSLVIAGLSLLLSIIAIAGLCATRCE